MRVPRILLVGNHGPLMDSISARLAWQSSFCVSGILATPEAAVAVVRREPVDLVLFDIDSTVAEWPWDSGLLRELFALANVILLSAIIEDRALAWALDAGVSGLLLKRELSEEIVPAIQEVLAGGSWFSEDVRERIVVDANGARLEAPSVDQGG